MNVEILIMKRTATSQSIHSVHKDKLELALPGIDLQVNASSAFKLYFGFAKSKTFGKQYFAYRRNKAAVANSHSRRIVPSPQQQLFTPTL